MDVRRLGTGVLVAAAAVVVASATAWACVSGPAVNLSTVQAKPGEQVTVTGTGFRAPDPVQVHFNALDGPVLAELPKPDNREINATITVPPGTAAGNYVLIVTQSRDGHFTQSPIRAVLTVVGPSGQSPILGADPLVDQTPRVSSLVRTDTSVSSGTLALIALGVGGIGMFAAGIAAVASGRRWLGAPAAVPVTKR